MSRYLFLVAVLLGLAGVLLYRVSAPPHQLTIAAGPQGGGYHLVAERYRNAMARRGVTLTLVETSGARENLDLITGAGKRVDVALVQGGLASGRGYPTVSSIGRHFYEPLLIFVRAGLGRIERLKQLEGRRIAVGGDGTGTQVLARSLLTASGLPEAGATLLPLRSDEARDKLLRGEIDAAMFVMAIEAPIIQTLIKSDAVRIVSLARAEAFSRRFGYLSHLSLPEGAIDLPGNLPSARVDLVAATAAVLVRNELHPALVNLLTEVVSETHRSSRFLGNLPQETKQHDPEYDLADAATRFYRHGVPFLHRHFPFWIADFLEQVLLFGLPALAVLVPLVGGATRLYQWHWQRRLHDWSKRLIELQAASDEPLDMEGARALDRSLVKLVREMRQTRMPSFYTDQVLLLLEHAQAMKQRVLSATAPSRTGPWS